MNQGLQITVGRTSTAAEVGWQDQGSQHSSMNGGGTSPPIAELLLTIDGCCGGRVKWLGLLLFVCLREVVLDMWTINAWPTPMHVLATLI